MTITIISNSNVFKIQSSTGSIGMQCIRAELKSLTLFRHEVGL